MNIPDCTPQITGLYESLEATRNGAATREPPVARPSPNEHKLTSDQVLQLLFNERKKGNQWRDLIEHGNWSPYYPSQSEGEYAAAEKLGYYTQGDESQVEVIMWGSALRREKWTKHRTYLRDTITKALSGLTSFYSPQSEPQGPDEDYVASEEGQEGEEAAEPQEPPRGREGFVPWRAFEKLRQEFLLSRLENKVLRHPDPDLRRKVLAILECILEVERLKRRGHVDADGYAGPIPVIRIAEKTGLGENTVSSHLHLGEAAGFFVRRMERERKAGSIDPNTGEITTATFVCRTFYRLAKDNLLDELRLILAYRVPEKERSNWGGYRPRCSEHPDAEVIKLTVYKCSECGKTLDIRTETYTPDADDERSPEI